MYAKSTRPSARSRKNGTRSATIKSHALGALKPASDENVPAKRADFFLCNMHLVARFRGLPGTTREREPGNPDPRTAHAAHEQTVNAQ